jgi:hypothetical protein
MATVDTPHRTESYGDEHALFTPSYSLVVSRFSLPRVYQTIPDCQASDLDFLLTALAVIEVILPTVPDHFLRFVGTNLTAKAFITVTTFKHYALTHS